MLKTPRQIRKSPFLLFPVTLLLVLLLCLPWVSAEETRKPKPQNWEIKGIVAALADLYPEVRLEAVNKLAQYQLDDSKSLINNYKDVVDKLVQQLSPRETDDNKKSVSRQAAAKALGQMQAKDIAPQVAALLKDSHSGTCFSALLPELFKNNCRVAVDVLPELGQQGLPIVVPILESVWQYPSEVAQHRFLAHFIGGGFPDVETLMQWVGKPSSKPDKLSLNLGRKIMKLFDKTWKMSESTPGLRRELAVQIAEVANRVSWKSQDTTLLQNHHKNLKADKDNSNLAASVKSIIDNLEFWKWFFLARNIILIHLTIWLALILAYPKSPQVQTIFWNPWIRRIGGFGYIGLLLTWVPYLRRRLFEPFKLTLLADAGLDNFNEQTYFPESLVKVPVSSEIVAVTQALPDITGQIVLEGDSGLGKSMFLRHLVKTSQRIVAYLPAQKCDNGVISAIYAKLQGQIQDANFLRNLIYHGAVDICIDGLNEVTADTRAKVCQFVESYFRGNIIMTTQPLDWIPPSTAKKYELQPLERKQIEQFLISRQQQINLTLPYRASLSLRRGKDFSAAKSEGEVKIEATTNEKLQDYEQACSRYITEAFDDQQSPEDLAVAKRILSNPMDLTLVALMLSQGKQPDLFRLQEQQYQLMAEQYLREWKHEFPLKHFSQAVYQMRLNDESAIPAEEFHQELISMEDEKYKMVVSRQWEDGEGKPQKSWYFRHDKIMEFFLVQNFLSESEEVQERVIQHIHDPRFRGVYILLADLLPLDAALELREILIEYAANSKDHTLTDLFVKILKLRLSQQLTQDGRLKWKGDTFKQILRQQKQKAKCLDLATEFLKLVGAKIKHDKDQSLIIESIEGSLSFYPPLPVLVTVDAPTDKDVNRLVEIFENLANANLTLLPEGQVAGVEKPRVALLFYRVPPDTTAKMEIAKVRLRDHFVLIPIPLAQVKQKLANQDDCKGLLQEYSDRYLQRADFFDDKNAITDTFSFFGRTEILQRLAEELLRYQGIGLFGLRKSGKTSILFQLGFMLREYPVIHIDLQRHSSSRYGAALFNDILQRLANLANEAIPHFQPLPDKPAAELTGEFIQRVIDFGSAIQESKNYKLPIMCFLDEVERILPTPEDSREKAEEFNACFGALRVLCQQQRQLSLLVADVHPDCNRINLWQQQGVATNPVFSFFKEVFLPPFFEEETKDMLINLGKLMGLEFDQETPKQIHQQSGGHPFISRQLARFLTGNKKDKNIISKDSIIKWATVKPYLEKSLNHKGELKNYLEKSIWEDLEKRGFVVAISILRVIACNEHFRQGITEQALLNQLKTDLTTNITNTTNQCLDACMWLTNVGLLYHEEVEHQDFYQIRIPLLSQWIQMQMTQEEIKQCKIHP